MGKRGGGGEEVCRGRAMSSILYITKKTARGGGVFFMGKGGEKERHSNHYLFKGGGKGRWKQL